MKVLVTGSAGHPGEALVRSLRKSGHDVVGLDILESDFTTHMGSIVDRSAVQFCMKGVETVLHTATLHIAHVATHRRQEFVDVNITGTQNLLEEADSARVRSFVYTRTTSVFGDALIPSPGSPAAWFTEDVRPVIGFTSTIVLAMNFGGGLAGACIGGIMAYALVKVPAGVFDPPPEALTVPWVYLVLLFVSAIGLTTAVVAAHLQDLQSKSVVGELRSGV